VFTSSVHSHLRAAHRLAFAGFGAHAAGDLAFGDQHDHGQQHDLRDRGDSQHQPAFEGAVPGVGAPLHQYGALVANHRLDLPVHAKERARVVQRGDGARTVAALDAGQRLLQQRQPAVDHVAQRADRRLLGGIVAGHVAELAEQRGNLVAGQAGLVRKGRILVALEQAVNRRLAAAGDVGDAVGERLDLGGMRDQLARFHRVFMAGTRGQVGQQHDHQHRAKQPDHAPARHAPAAQTAAELGQQGAMAAGHAERIPRGASTRRSLRPAARDQLNVQ
jgi:hypothetical protein